MDNGFVPSDSNTNKFGLDPDDEFFSSESSVLNSSSQESVSPLSLDKPCKIKRRKISGFRKITTQVPTRTRKDICVNKTIKDARILQGQCGSSIVRSLPNKRGKNRAMSFSEYRNNHQHPPSPARNKIDKFYFAHLSHQANYSHMDVSLNHSHVINGFEFLQAGDSSSICAGTTDGIGRSCVIKSEYGDDLVVNSRYTLLFHVLEWPKDICECYSDTALCPSELTFSGIIVAKDNVTGNSYKIIPDTDVWVTAKLLGYDRKTIPQRLHHMELSSIEKEEEQEEEEEQQLQQQEKFKISELEYCQTSAIANEQHGTIKFPTGVHWNILEQHPVFPGQKSLIMINKSSVRKRDYHGAKQKDLVCGDCRSELIDKNSGVVKFSGLNISIPEHLPATSVEYPKGSSRISWDYVYKLIFYARVKLPFARNKTILIGAVTDRIVAGRTRNTIKSRKSLQLPEECLNPG